MDRGTRRYRTKNVVSRRYREMKHFNTGPITDRKVGRCKKHHPLDCGRPHCYVCHSMKILDIKDKRTEISDCQFRDDMNDLNANKNKLRND